MAAEQAAGVGRIDPKVLGRAGIAVVIVAALALVVGLGFGRWSSSHRLVGTSLGGVEAPGFTLTNQDGQRVSLSDFLGKPVVLTFLYTHCPDVCPIIADKLREALDQLGPDASKVAVVAVSTDPRQDDRLSVARFSEQHRLTGRWSYLLGSPGELEQVWKGYYVAAQDVRDVNPAGGVIHTAALFFIDKAGHERVLSGADFEPEDVVHNLRAMLAG
ncbi:MAG TPA: SCO family protein [Chloroflexota bacterium]|nr:SCO family protein [Chloroflexota bacterium]